MSHHGSDLPMSERLKHLMDAEPGPTLRHPRGKLTCDDDGEISIRIAADRANGVVVFDFGVPTKWIGFTHQQARDIAALLIARADEVQGITA